MTMTLKRIIVPAVAFACGAQAGSEFCGEDATAESNPTCYSNILWAKEHGLDEKPEWYKNFPFLHKSSPDNEFQYTLTLIRGLHDNKDNCTLPCSLSPETIAKYSDAVAAAATNTADATSGSAKEASDAAAQAVAAAPAAFGVSAADGTGSTTEAPTEGWSIWTWLLIGAAVCCLCPCLGLACSAFLCYESVAWLFECGDKPEKKKSKKRARKVAEPSAPAPAPAQEPQPTAASFIPMMQPMAAPVAYAQPVHTVTRATPITTVVAPAPAVYYTAPAATSAPVTYAVPAAY